MTDATPPPQAAAPPAVEMIDGAVYRGGRVIWQHVSTTVRPGEFVAILGPNGAGKSTFVHTLLGDIPLAHGTLRVLGDHPGAVPAALGYLPQRRSFSDGAPIRGLDLVGLGLDGHRWGVPLPWGKANRVRRARIDEVVDLVDAVPFASRPIGDMSGGEQQRLLIAQALVRDPSLLLLDEPLDSLDLPSQASVAALLARLSGELGIAVVLVAHDVNPMLGYLDQVIYLGGGSGLAGPPDEVITSASLTELYGTPVEVLTASDGRSVVVGQPEAAAQHTGHHGHHSDTGVHR